MRSDAQKAADDKYKKEHTRLLQARVPRFEEETISQYCKKMNIPKARFLVWACNYFIQRGELPPESEVKPIEDYTDNDE